MTLPSYIELTKKEKADFSRKNATAIMPILIGLCSNSNVVSKDLLEGCYHDTIVDNAIQIVYELALIENSE